MKITKKIFSFILAMIMIFSVSSVAFAVEETDRDCPVIHIPGFYSSNVYGDVNDPDTILVLPGTDTLIEFIKQEFVPALLIFCIDRDTDKLATSVCEKINVLFKDWFNESTGDAKEGSGLVFDSTPDDVTKTSDLTFRYDWRGDLTDIADDLNDYINYVTSAADCDKVALPCHSFGSNLILAYMAKYGSEKISAVVFDSPACNGVAVVGNLLTGKVTLDSDFVINFLKVTLGEAEYSRLASSVLDIFELAGLSEFVTVFLDDIIETLAPAVYKETVAPLFGYWPGIWAMVPDAQINEAMAYIFDDILKDEDLSVLKARINEYNTLVRPNKETVLREFDEKGNFAVLSRYGAPAFPLTDSSELVGDTVIETRSSSLGATTAPVGTYFTEEETAGIDAKYISPDRTVNASTCMFPEQTWFIKDSEHFETHFTDDYYDFFLFAEEEVTCDKTDFGRFCTFDGETYELIPDTSEPKEVESSAPLSPLLRFLTALFEFLTSLFGKFFS